MDRTPPPRPIRSMMPWPNRRGIRSLRSSGSGSSQWAASKTRMPLVAMLLLIIATMMLWLIVVILLLLIMLIVVPNSRMI